MANPGLVEFDFDDAAAKLTLAELKKRIRNLQPVLKEFAEYMLFEIDEGYIKETDPFGVPWEKNSAVTIARKKATNGIMKVLQDRGLMRAAYTYKVQPLEMQITNNDPKARKHQLGIGVKKRVHMAFNKDTRSVGKSMITNYILSGRSENPR